MLEALINEASNLAQEAHDLLEPVASVRTTLRNRLLDEGRILTIADTPPAPCSLVAVDGGSVREPLYAADLLVCVATSATGMTSTPGPELEHAHWAQVLEHTAENQTLLGAAMASLELRLLQKLTHDIRILDGSTTSGIISLSQSLNIRNPTAVAHAAALFTDDLLSAIHGLASPHTRDNPGQIVALPKSDSSDAFQTLFAGRYNLTLTGGDKFIAAQVLDPGEMYYPRAAPEHQHPPVSIPRDAPGTAKRAAEQLAEAVQPIATAAADRRIVVTYLKPATADTVIKAEIQTSEPLPADRTDHHATAVTEVRAMGRILSDETPGPFLQEPYAQYAVDLAAKNVSVGVDALQQAMIANLAAEPDAANYLMYLTRSYRTRPTPRSKRPPKERGTP